MVEWDFNHSSVILCSIGNEAVEPVNQKGIDAGKATINLCRELDPIRPSKDWKAYTSTIKPSTGVQPFCLCNDGRDRLDLLDFSF